MRSEPVHRVRAATLAVISVAVGSSATGCVDEEFRARSSALVAVCADSVEAVPEAAWLCPERLTVECDGGDGTASVDALHVVPGTNLACAGLSLGVSDPGPFATGTHAITVTQGGQDAGGEPLCEAELVVVDTQKPVATDHSVILWPANGLMHTVTPDDCVAVEDRCDGILHARFTSALVAGTTRTHHHGGSTWSADIVFAPDQVSLRAVSNGRTDRTYRLGYVVTDAAGHRLDGVCTVVVPAESGADGGVGDPGSCRGREETRPHRH